MNTNRVALGEWLALLLFAIVVLNSSCVGGRAASGERMEFPRRDRQTESGVDMSSSPAAVDSGGLAGKLPPVPAQRETSVIAIIRDGKDTYDRSAGAEVGSSLILIAPEDGICWAIWQLGDESPPACIDLDLTVPLGNQAYIALADYTRGSWEIQGPVFASRVLPLDPLRHISPTGNVYVALILFDGAAATALQLSLLPEYTNQPPQPEFRPVPASGEAPLHVEFDARDSSDPEEDTLTYLWDFDGDGIFDLSGSDEQPSFLYEQPGAYSARLLVVDEEGESALQVQDVIAIAPDTIAPEAVLSPDEALVPYPFEFFLGCTSSKAEQGLSIVKFELDLDGDGIYDQVYDNTPFQQDLGANEKTKIDLGPIFGSKTFHPKLRVTDSNGNQDTDTCEITASIGLTLEAGKKQIADVTGDEYRLLSKPSLAAIGGLPAVAFYDAPTEEIHFRIAQEANGTIWNPAIKVVDLSLDDVDEDDLYFYHTISMIEAAGRPAICFAHPQQGLKYIRASAEGGTSWDDPIEDVADAPAWIESARCMASSDDQPGIVFFVPTEFDPIAGAHYGPHGGDLYFVGASNPEGSSWFNPQLLDTKSFGARIAEVSDNPAVLYRRLGAENYELRFERAGDGLDWSGASKLLDYFSDYTLEVIEGLPAVIGRNPSLTLVRALNVSGSSWGEPIELPYAMANPTLLESGGVLSLCGYTINGPVILHSTDLSGENWGIPVFLDTFGWTGLYPSCATVNGQPALCYGDHTEGKLLYVQGDF